MSSWDWRAFLERWSRELLLDDRISAYVPDAVKKSNWLGFTGATDDQLAELEAHLGVSLPFSYSEFLRVTNGWRLTIPGNPWIQTLWSAREIEWFAVRHQDWIDAHAPDSDASQIRDEDYLVYGEEQASYILRPEYLQTALEISDRIDRAMYLLNPRITTPEGEWEAWFFADWLPGAVRYRSFQDMMKGEYEYLLRLGDKATLPVAAQPPGFQVLRGGRA